MDESKKRRGDESDDGPRKAQRTESITNSEIAEPIPMSEAAIVQVLQDMEKTFKSWDTTLCEALSGPACGFDVANKAILNNLREDFMVSGFGVFKKRVMDITCPYNGGNNGEEAKHGLVTRDSTVQEVVRGVLGNMQELQKLLGGGGGGGGGQPIPGLGGASNPHLDPSHGSEKPMKQESPGPSMRVGRESSSYTIGDADAFLQGLEAGMINNPNPVPSQTPHLGYQPGYWFPSVPQHQLAAIGGQAIQYRNSVPAGFKPRHPFHVREGRASGYVEKSNVMVQPSILNSTFPPKKPSHLFETVCPFDLLGKPCPRDERGRFNYPCDGRKVCKRGTNCQSSYCRDLHIAKTCKSYVHNGKCENGGSTCRLGHDHVWERRQVADRARAHEKGVPFMPSSGQVRGGPRDGRLTPEN